MQSQLRSVIKIFAAGCMLLSSLAFAQDAKMYPIDAPKNQTQFL